jgi:hypothetical protein
MSVQELLLEYFRVSLFYSFLSDSYADPEYVVQKSIPEMKIDPSIIGDICVGEFSNFLPRFPTFIR